MCQCSHMSSHSQLVHDNVESENKRSNICFIIFFIDELMLRSPFQKARYLFLISISYHVIYVFYFAVQIANEITCKEFIVIASDQDLGIYKKQLSGATDLEQIALGPSQSAK